ncbi:hypothetical protein AB6A40_006140 [Gnathostoma spinigerum]|uniref:Uncharacterized protein n=1 Tax=Gnathostoma spinigerum TaxID=75299 RepID=A0ABD6EI63_9BILA
MNDLHLQLILAFAMLATTIAAGFFPLKILGWTSSSTQNIHRASFILSLLSCFAGGVFIATSFLDIIPHVFSNFAKLNEASGLNTTYPLPGLFICIGFFLVYLLEVLFALLLSSDEHKCTQNKNGTNDHELFQLNEMNGDAEPKKVSDSLKRHSLNRSTLRMSIEVEECKTDGFLYSVTFATAMSFHSILEGLALGVQKQMMDILTLFLSLLVHKGIEAFSVGLQVTRANSPRLKPVIIIVVIYALMTPLGSIIGVIVQQSYIDVLVKEGLMLAMEAFAAGTFIYVTFFEILAAERSNEYSSTWQLMATAVGFSVISLLALVEAWQKQRISED